MAYIDDSTNPQHPSAWDDRTRALIGTDGADRLARCRVLVVGVGGVGGYAAEMLVRSGIGRLTIIDADNVDITNLNRQLIATHLTLGREKVIEYAERFHEINPEAAIDARCIYIDADSVPALIAEGYDYVIDAIDTVAPKVALIEECLRTRTPIISSMGAGGRMDATKISVTDLWSTGNDGLARAVRQRLKRDGLRRRLTVVASSEAPRRNALIDVDSPNKRTSYGTIAAIPAMFGIMAAQHAINRLLSRGQQM